MKERFDYGQNPDKTEGGELISSYGWDHMTADAEFLLSKAKYKAATGREVAAMIVLKILAAPVMVALSLLAAMVTFLFCVASAVCELGCIVLTLLSLILFIGGQTVGGIVFLVLAFLVSPFGVPATAEWLVDKLHSAKFALRDFITG